ncbi:replicative DNA helicase [Kushneria indalinina]|uniref:Replicative DNA helicase n=1 Tax=Kushneria indalinina DSM 14324 TaxID=1122140 RepID=A0A3D9DSL3_9GAMM|nr:replicative DNA helicase [Kushneria indalinina]REC93399.1 replicative DNA helicase [Kushneria indalinina DSM 14324]
MSTDQFSAPVPTGDEIAASVPPHSVEAEESTLGALMLDNDKWDDVCEIVDAHSFYRHQSRLIFKAMQELSRDEKPLDLVTISELLERDGHLETVGGMAYMSDLVRGTPSAVNIVAYAEIVREHQRRRQLINMGRDLSQHALDGKQLSQALIEATERQLFELAENKQADDNGIRSAVSAAIDTIDRAFNAKDGITGTPTGYADLDNLTSGLQDADLVVIAARPSMGKTTFGMNLVENALIETAKNEDKQNAPIFVFSLEMPREALMLRLMASMGRIDLSQLRSGKLDDEGWTKLSAATSRIISFEERLFIDDSSGLSATALKSRARRLMRRHGKPALVLIDYIQLLEEPGCENRNNEVSAISRILKGTAKDLNCPVVALSQLNRGLEQRPNKRPVMADLRDSGAIEQDADVIGFLYRDEVYNKDNPDNKGLAELILGKQRNGPIETVHLAFIGAHTRFESLEYKQMQEVPHG